MNLWQVHSTPSSSAIPLPFQSPSYFRHISDAQKCYSASADRCQTPPPDFKISDKVFVKSDNIRTTQPSKKLAEKFLGPFKILAQVGSVSFTLHLPDSMHSIHPIFHVSMLEPSTPNEFLNRTETPPAPVIINRETEFEISETLDSKIDKRHKCRLQYLVKWSGYEGTDEETSWIPACNGVCGRLSPRKPGQARPFFLLSPCYHF